MRNIEFRICYQYQDGQKEFIYEDNDHGQTRYLINLKGFVFENYGTSWSKPEWESVFDAYAQPWLQQYTNINIGTTGTKIWEGDILRVPAFVDDIRGQVHKVGIVNYSVEHGGYIVEWKQKHEYYPRCIQLDGKVANNAEYLGNVFMNEMLLTEHELI